MFPYMQVINMNVIVGIIIGLNIFIGLVNYTGGNIDKAILHMVVATFVVVCCKE